MTNRVAHVVAQLHGEESLEVYAARAGVDVAELREWKALYLAGGEAAFVTKPSRARAVWLVAAVALAGALPLTAWAATCTPALPAPLKTFCAESPAVASDVNTNFQILANTVLARTGGTLDGGSNIVQTGFSRLLSTDDIIRVGGDHPTTQLQLDTSSGGSGAALYVGSADTLFVNRNGTFTGGTTVEGPLAITGAGSVAGNLTVNTLLTTGGQLNIGDSSHPTNLGVWGELQANTLRQRNCSWRGGAWVQRDTDTGAQCNAGEYSAGVICKVPTGYYLVCSVYCCSP